MKKASAFEKLFFICQLSLSACGSPSSTPLISSSLNGVEIQEKIWQDRDNFKIEEAETLQATLSQVLVSGNCNPSNKKLDGSTEKLSLECDHGIGAVFKEKQIPFPFEEPSAENENSGLPLFAGFYLSDANAELAAYAMDRLLNLNVVPTTQKRKIQGFGIGSAQYFVKGATNTAMDLNITGFRRMLILDYIDNNADRWEANWLYLPNSNRIVAIDNSRSFRLEETPPHPPPTLKQTLIYLQGESTLAQTIKTLSDGQIYKTLKPYLRTSLINPVLDRIHQLQVRL